ncbi:DUF3108 domain-containing protein [Pseudidiomarina donghaiensis]|uniref:DUF3108 domain-containing protein n=1 Tax=Pseudidiomarina donghaiensis TaxID=519452 RepID=A0A432XEI8_9GAMM|nr:DUF3108 domain-containing protein [Pseudidiomarina donghaiensis]RUO47158.1 DUF3108 domain-containing protein [Pseudidiomarina donghaiensis]SFV23728.1 Protein of unknown function [Pseudidiomarina donghaiensis]
MTFWRTIKMHFATLQVMLTGALLTASFTSSAMVSESNSATLIPYETRYEVLRGGSNYGEAVRSLSLTDGVYKLYTETEISLLFLSDRRRFWSEFVLENGRIQTQTFAYKRSGTGRDKGFSGIFDWQQKQLINRNTKQPVAVNIVQHSMDEAANVEQLRLDVQNQAQTDFVYNVIDEKGQADELRFQRVGEEVLTLPYGEITAVKVERVRENSRRETDYWFAPELGYVLVKMAQREDGDEVATLQLSHIQQ